MELYRAKMCKIIFLVVAHVFCLTTYSQVGIGIENVRGANLLDFGKNTVNGIVLPYNFTTENAVEGTLRVEANTAKIQYFNNETWVDLTDAGLINTDLNSGSESDSTQGVIIADKETNTPGVLVLESESKGMVLPQIDNPHLTIVNPPTGMICYDPINKTIAMFNGVNWFFYK